MWFFWKRVYKKLNFGQNIECEANPNKQQKIVKTVNFDYLDGIVTWWFVCKKSVFLKELLISRAFGPSKCPLFSVDLVQYVFLQVETISV